MSPELLGACALQPMRHIAVLELLVGNLQALWSATGVKIVAVLEVGVLAEGVAFADSGIVRAGI